IERVIVKSQPLPKTGGGLNLPIIGEVENVAVDPPGVTLEARIDTGAASSSMHAENIQMVERDGSRYVRFSVLNPETNELMEVERKLHRKVLIKQQTGEYERRYVVKLWLSLGGIKEQVDVTLTDRSDFEYPLLVGRNLLTDTAIVDVSRKHTLK
ncbi:ATP-dependent zinc protease family protein, partial [Porticoccus sp.]